MRTVVTLLLLSIIDFLNAQNLVPNPSFEEYKELRCDLNVPIIPPYENPKIWFEAILKDWTLPTNLPSQLYSILLPDSCSAYPTKDRIGFPKDGFNIMGIELFIGHVRNANGRTYIQTKLKENLKKKQWYLAGGYYSLANNYGAFATNNLGMLFTEGAIGNDTTLMLKYSPQINEDKVNNEPAIWKRFGGCFESSGDEQYLTIGGFFEDKSTKVVQRIEGDVRDNNFAAYLIDSVFVERVNELNVPNVITPNGDRFNEKFIVEGLKKNQWNIEVFNRWGKSVYRVKNYENEWDGGGLSEGVYFYLLSHNVCKELLYKGTISILK